MSETLRIDRADIAEAELLADLNLQLMVDEEHPYPLERPIVVARMRRWIAGEYQVLLFRRGARVAGYAVWRLEDRGAYLRHFFICRDQRREGWGRAAMRLLVRDVFPKDQPLQLEASTWNTRALDFWHALGFKDIAIALELKVGESLK
jgi:ribosomal protein S18 acetylase RimI-like enzyme